MLIRTFGPLALLLSGFFSGTFRVQAAVVSAAGKGT